MTCHQPISMPTSPRRGRTCQCAAAALADVARARRGRTCGAWARAASARAARGSPPDARRALEQRRGPRAGATASSSRTRLELAEREQAAARASRRRRPAAVEAVGLREGGTAARRRAALEPAICSRSSPARAASSTSTPTRGETRSGKSASLLQDAIAPRRPPRVYAVHERATSTHVYSASSTWIAGTPGHLDREQAHGRVRLRPAVAAGDREQRRDGRASSATTRRPGAEPERISPRPSRSPSPAVRSPGARRRALASSAQTGTPVSTTAIVSASSSRFRGRKPPCSRRSSAAASIGVRSSSGSSPTWR